MLSTFAIVIAGISLIIVITTVYRNSPSIEINDIEINNMSPNIPIEMGDNGMVEIQTIQEVAIVDSELNLTVV